MMTTAISAPFSFTEFQQDLSTANERKLLTWASCKLYVAVWRSASGEERPAVLKISTQYYYAASSSADALQSLFSRTQFEGGFEEGSELAITQLSLAELARNAHHYQLGLHLNDEQAHLYFAGSIMTLWGETAILEDDQGQEIIYRAAEVFTFEPDDNPGPIPHGAVQYWNDSDLEYKYDRDLSNTKSLYIFDDHLDWSSPQFPDLPDNAKALSRLSPSAQAFFERMRTPMLPSWGGEPEAPATPEHIYKNSLVETANLSHFNQLRAMVDQDIVPAADGITLTITKDPKHDDGGSGTPERWEIRVSFTTSTGINAVFSPDWIEASICIANTQLPDTIGTHRASESLRERIVNHLAWSFFQHGRSFVNTLFSTDLQGLLPGFIINSYEPFQPNYADECFPCLARFQCGEHGVPVLLLGQNAGSYVCMPLAFAEIPEADVSPLIPRRNELISIESRSMLLAKHYDKLAIPASLIDFPDHWYQGIRVSNQYLKTKFVTSMRFNSMMDEMQNESATTANSLLKWVVAGFAAVLIGVLMAMNL